MLSRRLLACAVIWLAGRGCLEATSWEHVRAEIQPGHPLSDDESVEEVQTHNETMTAEPDEDATWVPEAVMDVAYYLRRHKFSGYDRRYQKNESQARRNFFAEFPQPPLRMVHWEVEKHCSEGFLACLRYLQQKVNGAVLTRYEDSNTMTETREWDVERDKKKIERSKKICLEALKNDSLTFEIFQGPLERFQWLTSAGYFMCHYTTMQVRHLSTFPSRCDNFANCSDPTLDPRAVNATPFACALYSFCPDPCCSLPLVSDLQQCNAVDPCMAEPNTALPCALALAENRDMDGLMWNQWNVTCSCGAEGFRWESKSGMCVDIDECVESTANCSRVTETCLNTMGGYQCTCSPLGYVVNTSHAGCVRDAVLWPAMHPEDAAPQGNTSTKSLRLLPRSTRSSTSAIADVCYILFIMSIAVLAIVFFYNICSFP